MVLMSGPGPDEGAKITPEVLRIGFTKMKSKDREIWLNDVKNEDFTLQRLKVGTREPIGNPVSLTPYEFEKALVTPPKQLHTIWGMRDENLMDVDTTKGDTSSVGDAASGDADETVVLMDKTEKKENKNNKKKNKKKKKKHIVSEDSNDDSEDLDDYSKKMLDGSSVISSSSSDDDD